MVARDAPVRHRSRVGLQLPLSYSRQRRGVCLTAATSYFPAQNHYEIFGLAGLTIGGNTREKALRALTERPVKIDCAVVAAEYVVHYQTCC